MEQAKKLKVALVDLDGQIVPDWVRDTFERGGIELVVQQCTSRHDLASCADDADIVWLFGGSPVLQHGNLDAVPRCRAIVRTGSGTDNVPVDEATRRRIIVANTPQAVAGGVADHVVALLFAVSRRIAELDRSLRLGQWKQASAWPISTMQGQTLGIVGFGHIARQLIQKIRGFEMRVVAHDPYVASETMAALGVAAVEFRQLLADADFVSLHCPLVPATRHLIGEPELRLMKPTAILINTSRGGVVDEVALVRALREGWIAGAGLDVMENEPPNSSNPLLTLDNVVLTPHVAGYSADGMALRWKYSVETVLALARGEPPRSCVNPHVLSGR
jgi:D-3-phosphoglycerate dehydrogenase